MTTSNPVSPKLIAGAIAGIGLPTFVYLLSLVAENLHLIEGLPVLVYQVAAVVGFVLAGYLKVDPLRIPTLEPEALAKLPAPEAALHNAAVELERQPKQDPFI